MKYIDADRLRVEIESLEENARKIRVAKESTTNEKIGADGQVNLCQKLYLLIDSLQQEQPEVDLEKEIDEIWNPRFNLGWDEHSVLSMNHAGFASIAHHFYELGCRHAAEMYDDIEYNRQMAEEKQSVEGLEEELMRYISSDEYINTRES